MPGLMGTVCFCPKFRYNSTENKLRKVSDFKHSLAQNV